MKILRPVTYAAKINNPNNLWLNDSIQIPYRESFIYSMDNNINTLKKKQTWSTIIQLFVLKGKSLVKYT